MNPNNVLLVAAFAGGLLTGQQTVAGQQTNRRPDPATVESELEQGRPKAAPIAPASPAAEPRVNDPLVGLRADSRGLLWPEDFFLAGRRGRVRQHGQWWEFVFSPASEGGTDKPIKILPNSKLRQMVRYRRTSNEEAEFSITGPVTEYEGENYVLVGNVTTLARRAAPPTATVGRESKPNSEGSILKQLERDAIIVRSLRPLSDEPRSQHETEPSQRPWALSRERGALLPEGTRVSGQVGRLVRESDWWVFVLESDSDQPADVPVRLLPNLSLAGMTGFSEVGVQSPVFVVSGELTVHGAWNYMLIRRFRLRRPDGNIK